MAAQPMMNAYMPEMYQQMAQPIVQPGIIQPGVIQPELAATPVSGALY